MIKKIIKKCSKLSKMIKILKMLKMTKMTKMLKMLQMLPMVKMLKMTKMLKLLKIDQMLEMLQTLRLCTGPDRIGTVLGRDSSLQDLEGWAGHIEALGSYSRSLYDCSELRPGSYRLGAVSDI